MKKSMLRKVLLLACSAVLLVCLSVGATLAYLTSNDTVVNTFTVGKVAITLDETDVKLDGTKDTDARVKANDYKLMPGHTYIKDPTVTVAAGSENSYIRLLVTISNAANVKAVFGADFLPENYVSDWDRNVWMPVSITEDAKADTITYEFRYYQTVDASASATDIKLPALFKKFTVPQDVDNANLLKLQNTKITVVAHAIQADGFTTADAAWTAFAAQ